MSELIGLQAPVKPTAPADVIIDGTEATFAQDVIEASMERPVIVDFWAEWCGPCKMIAPFFEELAAKYPGVVFVKVDVDDLDDVAAECGISAMPTFQLYSNGVKVQELTGADKDKLEALAKSADDL